MVRYPLKEQIMDIVPSFMLALVMGVVVFVAGYLLPLRPVTVLLVQILIGALIVLVVAKAVRMDAYLYAKELISERLQAVSKV